MGTAISPRGDMPKHRVPLSCTRTHHVVNQHHLRLKNCSPRSARPDCPALDRRADRRGFRRRPAPDPGRGPPRRIDTVARLGGRVRRPLRRGRSASKGLKLSAGRRRLAAARRRRRPKRWKAASIGWAQAGLPLVPADKLPPRDAHGRTVWVTRARPKIDRIACPWLIRRFVDPEAVFLFVPPAEVAGVAERFDATPFDIEGECFWSHRGELCTFDVMVEEFGLATEPLLRLATIVRGADTARPRSRAGGGGPARRVARPVAHVCRRSRAARGRHGALRRVLSLVPRRHRRDPQLARRSKPRA